MSEALRTLSVEEIAAASPADWRHVNARLRVRYRLPDYATGLEFVARVGRQAEGRDHHPDITLRYDEVLVSTHSHDVDGITSRDVRLAAAVSALASELGLTADAAPLTEVEVALDTTRGDAHTPFYAALLGADVTGGSLVDAGEETPTLWWQAPDRETGGPALPSPPVPQRWHLDVWVSPDEGPRRVAAALAAGGTLVSDAAAPSYWVLADAEGNRSCICTVAGR